MLTRGVGGVKMLIRTRPRPGNETNTLNDSTRALLNKESEKAHKQTEISRINRFIRQSYKKL